MAFTPTNPANDSTLAYDSESSEQRSFFNRMMGLSRSRKFFSRAEESKTTPTAVPESPQGQKPNGVRKFTRRVVPGLPRPATFKRQNSERRDRLVPVESDHTERRAPSEGRAVSADRKRPIPRQRTSSLPADPARFSAPTLLSFGETDPLSAVSTTSADPTTSAVSPAPYTGSGPEAAHSTPQDNSTTADFSRRPFRRRSDDSLERAGSCDELGSPLSADDPEGLPPDDSLEDLVDDDIRDELDEKWILNLSMHFRDKSPREKFFVTYADTPNLWRRITVSVDYRHAPPDSLERDVQGLRFQRDKSARIYQSIRSSLPDIQFYDTVTNLRLETSEDDRLHVHVTEDVNEIIPYPSSSLLDHIENIPRISESDVHFQSHMSGFVYKVQVDGEMLIKKEIPGPDSVEEFLYEINALYKLRGARNVVQFQGLVVDEQLGLVKGILIAYAEKGPLVDLIFDYKSFLDWDRRERWAKEIVRGLAEIHEAGFVQGDFTLSNIVMDDNDTAIIIDINRRGCPVGWEPPEIAAMIQSGQRISMYIGVKSDLFQLGMVLWALAMEEDEPERQDRPLRDLGERVPRYYRDVVNACLDSDPRKRASATTLLARFPRNDSEPLPTLWPNGERHSATSSHAPTEYIDPRTAVGLEDIEHSRSRTTQSRNGSASRRFWDSNTYYDGRPSSTDMPFDGPSSYIVPRRGRSPPANTTHLASSPFRRGSSNPHSPSELAYAPRILPVSPSEEHKWEELVDPEGHTFLVETDEGPEEREARLQRVRERTGQNFDETLLNRHFSHVDSGFDEPTGLDASSLRFGRRHTFGPRSMEHVDSGLADMDLAGIGENEYPKEIMPKDLDFEEGQGGGGGRDLVTVDEHEVVEDFGVNEQQAACERIAAVDMAFSDRGGDYFNSKASDVNAPTATNHHDGPAIQHGRSALAEHIEGSQQGCK